MEMSAIFSLYSTHLQALKIENQASTFEPSRLPDFYLQRHISRHGGHRLSAIEIYEDLGFTVLYFSIELHWCHSYASDGISASLRLFATPKGRGEIKRGHFE